MERELPNGLTYRHSFSGWDCNDQPSYNIQFPNGETHHRKTKAEIFTTVAQAFAEGVTTDERCRVPDGNIQQFHIDAYVWYHVRKTPRLRRSKKEVQHG